MNEAFEAAAEQLHKAAGEKGYPDILSDENGRITVPRHIPAAVKRYVTGDLFEENARTGSAGTRARCSIISTDFQA